MDRTASFPLRYCELQVYPGLLVVVVDAVFARGWELSRRMRQAWLKTRYIHRAEVASKSRPALSLPALPPYRGKGRP